MQRTITNTITEREIRLEGTEDRIRDVASDLLYANPTIFSHAAHPYGVATIRYNRALSEWELVYTSYGSRQQHTNICNDLDDAIELWITDLLERQRGEPMPY